MKRLLIATIFGAALTLPTAGLALADNFHNAVGPCGSSPCAPTGQPDPMHNGIGCATNGLPASATPGNSANANNTGSPFNPNNAKTYAGNPGNPNPGKTGNTQPVSQYDVACFQQAQHQG